MADNSNDASVPLTQPESGGYGAGGVHRSPGIDDFAFLDQDLNRLALTNALKDFEVANARVIDLTRQLIDAARKLDAAEKAGSVLTQQLAQAEAELRALRLQYDELLSTRTFKVARVIWAARRFLHV